MTRSRPAPAGWHHAVDTRGGEDEGNIAASFLAWFLGCLFQTSLPLIGLQRHLDKELPNRGSTPTLPAKCVLESSLARSSRRRIRLFSEVLLSLRLWTTSRDQNKVAVVTGGPLFEVKRGRSCEDRGASGAFCVKRRSPSARAFGKKPKRMAEGLRGYGTTLRRKLTSRTGLPKALWECSSSSEPLVQ